MNASDTRHPDFDSEEAFLRHAYECLKTMRQQRASLGDAGGDPKASAALRQLREEALKRFDDPESIFFGRVDLVEGDQHYIGRQGIWEDGGDPIVINWRAPAAEPFYTATPDAQAAGASESEAATALLTSSSSSDMANRVPELLAKARALMGPDERGADG
ncbi:MAG: hypothetical protein ACRDQ2_01695 [Gaiellales bacterium]